MAVYILLSFILLPEIQSASGQVVMLSIQSPSSTSGEPITLTNDNFPRSAPGGTITLISGINSQGTNFGETTTPMNVNKSTDTASGEPITLINDNNSPGSASGESTTLTNDIKSPGTASGEITTLISEIKPPATASGEAITLINDNNSPDTASGETTTLVNNIRTLVISPGKITALIHDMTSLSTHETTFIKNYTFKCEATTVNISEKHEELVRFTSQLDALFEYTITTFQSFVESKNQTLGQFAMSVAENYLEFTKTFVEDFELLSKLIQCQNNTKSVNYEINDIEYKEKSEIVEILSNELGKIMDNETEFKQFQTNYVNEQNYTYKIISLVDELYSIVILNKKVKDLEKLVNEQHKIFKKSQKIRDLDDIIATRKEMINIQNNILHIIKSSENIKYIYNKEYNSKSKMVRDLVNIWDVRRTLNRYQENLVLENEDHVVQEALIQLNQVIRPLALGIIFVIGIMGNIVLLLVFINHKEMRTAPNLMIINLNVSDILSLIFNVLFYIIETLPTDWTLGTAICKMYRFGRDLTLGLSIYSIVVISMQRFIVLTDFFSCNFKCQFLGKLLPKLNILFVWIVASIIATPRAIKAEVDSLVCWTGSVDDKDFFNKLMFVDVAVYCGIPFIIICVTSGMTSMRLKSSIKNMPGEAMGKENAIKARVVSSKIFLALIIVFAACYIPYFTYITYFKHVGIDAPYMTVKYLSVGLYCLVHSNATFNPIALYLASAKYRKYMRTYICYSYRTRKLSSEASGESNITIETRM